METQNRPNAAAIKILKERIKTLSSKQRSLKLLRKTTLPVERKAALLEETGLTGSLKSEDAQALSYRAWSTVEDRRLEITACINIYHELRGSQYRHGVDKTALYYYEKTVARIRKETAM